MDTKTVYLENPKDSTKSTASNFRWLEVDGTLCVTAERRVGGFPGGPGAETLQLQCRGPVPSLVRELDPTCHN